jgi:tetratricopeptide (TPR) repeat protein
MKIFEKAVKHKVVRVDCKAMADMHRDAHRWSEAASAYLQHLRTSPSDFSIWVQYGNCSKEAGDFEEALRGYNSAIQLNPNDWDVHLQLGHLYKLMVRTTEAIGAYNRSLVLNPINNDAKHELASLTRSVREMLSDSPIELMTQQPRDTEDLIRCLRQLAPEADPFRRYFDSFDSRSVRR